jgi:hypothetical protein
MATYSTVFMAWQRKLNEMTCVEKDVKFKRRFLHERKVLAVFSSPKCHLVGKGHANYFSFINF